MNYKNAVGLTDTELLDGRGRASKRRALVDLFAVRDAFGGSFSPA